MADVTNEIMTNDKTKILSGEFLNFYTPRRQRIRSFKVYFSPKQEGEGTPSPDNVRPISGWTGVEVNHCGKNLLETNINSYHHPSNVKTEPNDLIFTDGELSGTITSGQRDIGVFVYDNILPPGTYTLSFDYINGIGNYYWRPCIIGKPSLAWTTSYKIVPMAGNDSGHITTTFTAEEDFCINLSLNCFSNASKTAVNKIYNLQLELGSEATEYTPYKTNLSSENQPQYIVDWSSIGTIYGGYVDLVSGELVETWVCREMSTFSSITAPSSASAPWNHRFTLKNWITGANAQWDRRSDGTGGSIRVLCDCIESNTGLGKTNYTGDDTTANWYVYDDTISTVAEFKEKYTGHYAAY